MADTITRAIDIEVNIIHGDKAKRELGEVASLADKTSGAAHKLLKELLDTAGGLRGVAVAAKSAGANLVPLEVVEDIARWFDKATTAVKSFEAKTVETGKSAKSATKEIRATQEAIESAGEGAAKSAGGFQQVIDELDRLALVQERARAEGTGTGGFVEELARSIEWLMPGVKTYARELEKLDKNYASVVWSMDQYSKEAEKIARANAKITTETKTTGGSFNFAWGKAVKFFGAIGFGVYSMYTLANAFRRGVRVIKDWITGGIEKAIEENAELSQLIRTQVTGALDKLQLKLGQQVTPGIKELAAAAGKLIRVLSDTGVIDAFGRLLGNMVTVAARGMDLLAEAADTIMAKVEEIRAKMPETKDNLPARMYKKLPKGVRVGTGAAMSVMPGMQPLGALTLGYEAGEYLQEPVAPEEVEWETATARQQKEKAAKAGKRPADISLKKYREARERLRAAEEVRGMAEYGAERREREMVFEPPEVLEARSREIKKGLTETEMDIEAKKIAKIKKQAEEIGQLINPTSYIIAGFKSGEMDKAIQEFATNLGETVAQQLLSKLIMMGVMAILNMLTGGASGGITSIMGPLKAQHGMYTGEYEGPVFVHRREVIQPLDTYAQMSKLLSKAQPGVAPAAAGRGGGGEVTVNVSERAGDLVDVHRTESVFRGGEALSALEAA